MADTARVIYIEPHDARHGWDEGHHGSHAVRALVSISSTVEEKLAAIDILTQTRAAGALEALQQAMFMLGLSRPASLSASGRRIGRSAAVPKGGEVASAAARALGSYADAGSLTLMDEVIADDRTSRVIRETVAYGLGGCVHPAVFSVYRKIGLINDPDVRFRVLLSLRESLDRILEVERTDVQEALSAVARLLINRVRELRGGEQDVLVSILARYSGADVEKTLANALMHSRDQSILASVLEVLSRRNTRTARNHLSAIFRSDDRPAALYSMITRELSRNIDGSSRGVAELVVRSYSWRRRLLSYVSPSERGRRAAHVLAAQTLLVG